MRKLFLYIFSLLILSSAFSQSESGDDFEIWNGINIGYRHNKDLQFKLKNQYRLKENGSVTDRYLTQLGAEYEVYKKIAVGASLRYISKNDNQGNIQGYRDYLRYQFDVSNEHELKRWTTQYRLRYQNRDRLDTEAGFNKPYLRLKSTIEYNIRKWKLDPEIEAEIFRPTESDMHRLDRLRLGISTGYRFENAGGIKVFYRLERGLNTPEPTTTKILGFTYSYTFRRQTN